MSIDENTRLDLRQAFEELIGPDLAHAAMEAMPPLDYNQFATKTDVGNLGISIRGEIAELRTELKSDIAEVRTEMTELRSELHTEVGALRTEMTELRSELHTESGALHTEVGGLRSTIELQLAKNLRATVLTQVATMAAFAGIITGLG